MIVDKMPGIGLAGKDGIAVKQGKRPTRKQKMLMAKVGLNPNNWLVVKNIPGSLHLEHRHTGRERVLKVTG